MNTLNTKLITVGDFRALLAKAPDELYVVSGDESLLSRLPKGNWIGGTIAYLMTDETGGLTTRDELLVQQLPITGRRLTVRGAWTISVYDQKSIARITEDAPANGYTFLMIPAFSDVHMVYGKEAPHFKNLFMHPIVGWISGVHLDDLGKKKPKVFNGATGEVYEDKALACHVPLPAGKKAILDFVNIFERSESPDIRFETDGFTVTDCSINGQKTNFASWLTQNKVDTQLPMIADYDGALINVSFQKVDTEAGKVVLYAPVFKDTTYRMAMPVPNYVAAFKSATSGMSSDIPFACNCVLNYTYGKLEGAKAGLPGPCTFGEIAFQLLNQTMVYLVVVDVRKGIAERMATAH
ncbi:MAG: DUF6976 family protein [Burkholderiales bacterium]